jgi:tetratricopeptide (TPR) repeat protein
MYLPMLGVALTVAHLSGKNRPFKVAIWILVLLFAALSMERATAWRNDEIFYADILAKNPRSFQALTATGEQEERAGKFAAAIEHFRKALEISPVSGAAQVGLAKSLLEAGRFSDAYIFLEPLVHSADKRYTAENRTYYGQLYYCLGLTEEKLGTPERAVRAFCNAQALLPSDEVVANALKAARATNAKLPPCGELIEKEKQAQRN